LNQTPFLLHNDACRKEKILLQKINTYFRGLFRMLKQKKLQLLFAFAPPGYGRRQTDFSPRAHFFRPSPI
jgi:hypothetical protein